VSVPPSRDDAGYWRQRPADHSTNGLYREGPQEAVNPLGRLIAPTHYTDPVPEPKVARRITAYIRQLARQSIARRQTNHQKLLRALRGERVRTQRSHVPPPQHDAAEAGPDRPAASPGAARVA
jgi:hypothetical protein